MASRKERPKSSPPPYLLATNRLPGKRSHRGSLSTARGEHCNYDTVSHTAAFSLIQNSGNAARACINCARSVRRSALRTPQKTQPCVVHHSEAEAVQNQLLDSIYQDKSASCAYRSSLGMQNGRLVEMAHYALPSLECPFRRRSSRLHAPHWPLTPNRETFDCCSCLEDNQYFGSYARSCSQHCSAALWQWILRNRELTCPMSIPISCIPFVSCVTRSLREHDIRYAV